MISRHLAVLGALALLSGTPASAESAGAWTYTAELKDGGGGFVTALSPAPAATYNDPSYLIARCISGRAEFLVGGQGGWGLSGRRLEVTAQVEGLLRAIRDPGKIRLSVKDPTGAAHENVFDTSGFSVVRAKIAKACGWPR